MAGGGGGGGGRDRTEAVGDFPAQLLLSSGEHRAGLQDSHSSGAQQGLGCSGSGSSQAGKLGTGGLCSSGETPGCPSAAGLRAVMGSAGSAAPGNTGTPQALRGHG